MQKMKRITLSSVALVVATVWSSSAWAWGGLTLPAPETAPSQDAAAPAVPGVATRGGLIQMGQPSLGEIGKAGYGQGVPLSFALGMLVPASWASGTDGVDPATLVSWKEGQSWPQALSEIANSQGWTIVLDWGGHTVTVEGKAKVAAARPAEAKSATPAAPAAPAFVIRSGQGIEAQLRQWGRSAGWKVVWNVPHDWVAPNDATFTGAFQDAAQQVVETLAANGADIRADVYQGNRTILIHSGKIQ